MIIRTIIVAAVASLSIAGTGLGQAWIPSELTATGGASGDLFGSSIAIDGSTCVIGANGTNSRTGSAYVFTNTNGTWSQVQELTASDGAANDLFGSSVAIDGVNCVIGAQGTNTSPGSAYVFTNTNGTWSQVAELTAIGGANGDLFGSSVAIDGDTYVIGAWGTNTATGSAYVFTNTNGTWSKAGLIGTGGASGDLFGLSVAIDGDTCVIGALGTNTGTGSAYVFTNTNGTWSQVAELTATDGASGDGFGSSVAIDGDTCVIGARGTNSFTGSAYVFTNTNGTWSQVAELTATGGASGDNIGYSVALDGVSCVIAAQGTNTSPGSAYVFTNTGGTWSQAANFTDPGGASNDNFGQSVAIDGDTCVIGAKGTDSNTGSAYIYGSGSAATGACCYDGLCFSITEAECTAVGGSFTAEACSADTACPTSCSSDSDNDGDVDIEDLLNLLSAFGACP